MSRKGRRVIGGFGVMFGSLFLLLGLFAIGSGLKRGIKQRNTADWPSVQGRILSLSVDRPENHGAESPLMYEYEVDGKVYRSTRVAYVDKPNLEFNEWIQLANGLPKDGTVAVYFDPEDPNESVLKAGEHAASWEGVKSGSLFAGFAAIWVTLWWGMSNWLPDRLSREVVPRGSTE